MKNITKWKFIAILFVVLSTILIVIFGTNNSVHGDFVSIGTNTEKYSFRSIIDVSKKGNTFDANFSVLDDGFYRFEFVYLGQIDKTGKCYPNDTVNSIAGNCSWSEKLGKYVPTKDNYGIQIPLNIIIASLDKNITSWDFTVGTKPFDITTYNGAKFTKTLNLGEHCVFQSTSYLDDCWGRGKRIVALWFEKGNYSVSLTALDDAKELSKIKTLLFITRERFGKLGEIELKKG